MTSPCLTIAVAWNGEYPIEPLLARATEAKFVAEVLVATASEPAQVRAQILAGKHAKMRVLPGSDTGIYNAWNKLVAATRTPYLTFHGADDLLVVDRAVTSALATGLQAPTLPMLVFTARVVDSEGKSISTVHHDERATRLSLGRLLSPLTPEVVYPTAKLIEVGGVDESFRIAGDADLYFKVRPRTARVDVGAVFVEMADGGASASAKHAWTVYCENRRIALKHDQYVPVSNRLISCAFLGLRHQMYRLGGERFAAKWTDLLRGLAGKASRYTR